MESSAGTAQAVKPLRYRPPKGYRGYSIGRLQYSRVWFGIPTSSSESPSKLQSPNGVTSACSGSWPSGFSMHTVHTRTCRRGLSGSASLRCAHDQAQHTARAQHGAAAHCTALLHNRRCLRFVWIGFGDRTGRAQPRSGTARLCEEQPSQKMKPQARQWCLTTYVHHPLRHRAEFATVAAVTRSVTVEVPTEFTYAFHCMKSVCRTVGHTHGYPSLSADR